MAYNLPLNSCVPSFLDDVVCCNSFGRDEGEKVRISVSQAA